MEIKTLEEYVLKELETKDNQIVELNAENVDLKLQMKSLQSRFDNLVRIISEHGEFKEGSTQKWFSVSVWKKQDEQDYEFCASLFRNLIDGDDGKGK